MSVNDHDSPLVTVRSGTPRARARRTSVFTGTTAPRIRSGDQPRSGPLESVRLLGLPSSSWPPAVRAAGGRWVRNRLHLAVLGENCPRDFVGFLATGQIEDGVVVRVGASDHDLIELGVVAYVDWHLNVTGAKSRLSYRSTHASSRTGRRWQAASRAPVRSRSPPGFHYAMPDELQQGQGAKPGRAARKQSGTQRARRRRKAS
jgi:hypothetical protein